MQQQQQQIRDGSIRSTTNNNISRTKSTSKQKRRRRVVRKSLTYRLIRTIFIVCCCILIATVLFQMDLFMKHTFKHHNNKKNLKSPRLSPDVLLKGDINNNNKRIRINNNNNNNNNNNYEEDNIIQLPKEKENNTGGRRKVAFDIENLKSNDDTGSSSSSTSRSGTIVLETIHDWSPLGVEQFWKLIEEDGDNFYEGCKFFRVIPNFIAQFGISGDPITQNKWRTQSIMDDPIIDNINSSNIRGTVSFAASGKNTRTTQLFINIKDNIYLDKEGFTTIGHIIDGIEYIDLIQDKYREKPVQYKIVQRGNDYLNEEFPDLSYISAVRPL